MELAHPLRVVSPTLDADVLEVLANARSEFTVGDVQRILGSRSRGGVRLVLERLADQGIAHRRPAGRAFLYSLNRQHLAAEAISSLANMRTEFFHRVHEALDNWTVKPVYGALFGSAVRGDHRPGSDIDLFLVQPDDADEAAWDEWVAQLAADMTAWTGNDTRPLVMREVEVHHNAAVEPVLATIAEEGLTMAGNTSWLLNALRQARAANPAPKGMK